MTDEIQKPVKAAAIVAAAIVLTSFIAQALMPKRARARSSRA